MTTSSAVEEKKNPHQETWEDLPWATPQRATAFVCIVGTIVFALIIRIWIQSNEINDLRERVDQRNATIEARDGEIAQAETWAENFGSLIGVPIVSQEDLQARLERIEDTYRGNTYLEKLSSKLIDEGLAMVVFSSRDGKTPLADYPFGDLTIDGERLTGTGPYEGTARVTDSSILTMVKSFNEITTTTSISIKPGYWVSYDQASNDFMSLPIQHVPHDTVIDFVGGLVPQPQVYKSCYRDRWVYCRNDPSQDAVMARFGMREVIPEGEQSLLPGARTYRFNGTGEQMLLLLEELEERGVRWMTVEGMEAKSSYVGPREQMIDIFVGKRQLDVGFYFEELGIGVPTFVMSSELAPFMIVNEHEEGPLLAKDVRILRVIDGDDLEIQVGEFPKEDMHVSPSGLKGG